jgi:nucleoside 2-deoxyribosyltransferase
LVGLVIYRPAVLLRSSFNPGKEKSNDEKEAFMMQEKKARVYLAGSIDTHTTEEGANGWRLYATEVLEKAGFEVINPFRGFHTKETPTEILERNREDITRSDVMLVEMMYQDRAYIGTAIDMLEGWELGMPIIVFGEANERSSYLQAIASNRIKTLGEALDFIINRDWEVIRFT